MGRSELREGTRYKRNAPPLSLYIAGEDIVHGSPVCQSPRTKNVILKADATEISRMPCIGALFGSVLTNQEAVVVPAGMFVNLRREQNFNPGDTVYVSDNKGYFTNKQPSVGEIQNVGIARNPDSALLYCIPPGVAPLEGVYDVGNHDILVTDGTAEVEFEGTFNVRRTGMLYVEFDLSEIDNGITITGRLYHKIDEANLVQIDRQHTKISATGLKENHMTLAGAVVAGVTIELSLQVDIPVAADRTVNHVFIQGGA